jgi:hypothetical protein
VRHPYELDARHSCRQDDDLFEGEREIMNHFVVKSAAQCRTPPARFAILDPPSSILGLYFGCDSAALRMYQVNLAWGPPVQVFSFAR